MVPLADSDASDKGVARLEELGTKKGHMGYKLEIIPTQSCKVKMNITQMLHVGNIYLHFPLDADIFHLM